MRWQFSEERLRLQESTSYISEWRNCHVLLYSEEILADGMPETLDSD